MPFFWYFWDIWYKKIIKKLYNFTIFQAPTDPHIYIRYTGVLTEVVWGVLHNSKITFIFCQLRILRDFRVCQIGIYQNRPSVWKQNGITGKGFWAMFLGYGFWAPP